MLSVRLIDRAVVHMSGPDAPTLLHNVLTLDMAGVERHGSGYGALLTPQGKILWDFILHKLPDGYAADIRADQAEAFAKRLSLYRLRSKVDIAVAPELGTFVEWDAGREGKNSTPGPSPQGGGERADHPCDPRVPSLGGRWVAPISSVATDASLDHWHRHRIALAVPEGGVDFVFGDTFPHDAAMDSLHGIAFAKGCYIGQEVVSRMRHRGTARRRIVALAAAATFPEVGTEITAEGRPLGRLGSSAGGRGIGLVRLDRLREALDAGTPVLAADVALTASLPSWATYGWPATAGAGED